MCASHWVAKPKGAMKVKVGFDRLIWDPVGFGRRRTIVPSRSACQWGGDRAYTLGPERW